jgi:hypothetical protein
MSFERGKDPKETMEIGRQKNAIPVFGIKYYSNNQEVSITDPEIIHIFLEQFTNCQLPYNPIFGPQRILIISTEKYLDSEYSSLVSKLSALSGAPNQNTDPIEMERSVDLNIFSYEGKTVIFKGKMYEMPSINNLEKNGFGYFEKCERNHLDLLNEKSKRENEELLAKLESMKSIMNSQHRSLYPSTMDELRKSMNDSINKINLSETDLKMDKDITKNKLRFLPNYKFSKLFPYINNTAINNI